MSSDSVAEATDRPPATVRSAAWALFASATVISVNAALSIVGLRAVDAAYRAWPDHTAAAIRAQRADHTAAYAGMVTSCVIAALILVCGVFVLRRSVAMRIASWVVAGLAALFFTCGALVSIGSGGASTVPDRPTIHPAGWYQAVNIGLAVVNLVALALAVTLLARPSSNAYFRRRVGDETGPPADVRNSPKRVGVDWPGSTGITAGRR
jgi:hypothetical protein